MRTIVIISAAILLTALPALAYHPATPYLGISLQMNNPAGDFGKDRLAPDGYLYPGDGAADAGGGVELDFGLANRHMNAYIGIRANKFDVHSPDGWEGKWTANRFLIGVRGKLMSDRGSAVVPTIGGGLTLGKTGLEGAIPYDPIIERNSDMSFGWFVEGGINARLSDSADLLANLQYHTFEADFHNGPFVDQFDISFVTLQIGVAVYLGE